MMRIQLTFQTHNWSYTPNR